MFSNTNIRDNLNYKYYGMAQMDCLLHKKNKLINDHRLLTLNINRDYLTMKNRLTDYQRLVNLLRLNDIPRIHQLINTCINSGGSTKTLISKVIAAIDGKINLINIIIMAC